jgi:hypothetical protein
MEKFSIRTPACCVELGWNDRNKKAEVLKHQHIEVRYEKGVF